MARLKRDVGRIEQAISEGEMNNVYYIGLHVNSTVATLDDMETPSAADIMELGISQDAELMKSTYQRLLDDLQPCRAYGARASLYYPLDSVLEAFQACRTRIAIMEDLTPQIFVCPHDHPLCKMP
jgi:hypothetical protein